MARLLVTGASGLLGANFLSEARDFWETGGLSRSGNGPAGCGPQVKCDLRDGETARLALDGFSADLIVHCAAWTDVDQCEANPEEAKQIHVEASRMIACWCAENRKRLVYLSTDSVFSGEDSLYSEADPPSPVNVYAKTKWEGELEVKRICPEALIIRTNMFGWNYLEKGSLAEWFLRMLIEKKPIQGFTDLRFTPLLVNDLSRLILKLIDKGAVGTFHLASRDSCSKYEFGVWLAEIFGFKPELITESSSESFQFRARRPKDTSLSVAKTTDFLKQEMPGIREGLKTFKLLLGNGFVEKLKGHAVPWVRTHALPS